MRTFSGQAGRQAPEKRQTWVEKVSAYSRRISRSAFSRGRPEAGVYSSTWRVLLIEMIRFETFGFDRTHLRAACLKVV